MPERVVVSLNRPPTTYTLPQLTALYREIEARLDRLPGVQGSGLALYNPLTDNWGELILVSGPSASEDERGGRRLVGPRQRELSAEPRHADRARTRTSRDADNETAELVAVVNEAFVKRFFKSDEDPLGQHFGLDLPGECGHVPHRRRRARREVRGVRA